MESPGNTKPSGSTKRARQRRLPRRSADVARSVAPRRVAGHDSRRAGYRIKKLRYEALPGLWIPALLYEPEKLKGRVPVVLNVNGHDSKGKAAPYKQIRCINLAKRGMLALNSNGSAWGSCKATDSRTTA